MKKILFTMALVAMTAIAAEASAYDYLTIQKSDGTALSFSATGLTITFSNGNLVATPSGGTATTLALSDLSKMFFSEISGIQPALGTSQADGSPEEVYDLQGRRIDTPELKGGITGKQSAELSNLPKGVYVVKRGNTSVKVIVK